MKKRSPPPVIITNTLEGDLNYAEKEPDGKSITVEDTGQLGQLKHEYRRIKSRTDQPEHQLKSCTDA